jgi:hypothetical protein
MARPVIFIRSDETSNDEMARSHTDSSSKQDRLATELVNVEQGRYREKKFNHTDNTGRQKSQRVTLEAEAPEDKGCARRLLSATVHESVARYSLVVDSVDTIPLLESHSQACGHGSSAQRWIGDQRSIVMETNEKVALEASVLILRVLLACSFDFEIAEGLDLEVLDAYTHIFSTLVAQTSQCRKCLFLLVLVHQVAR